MARYVVDAPTVLHLVDQGLAVHPSVQLVAPSSIRSEALQRLLQDVTAGRRTEAAALQVHERVTELKMRLLGDRVSRGTAWGGGLANPRSAGPASRLEPDDREAIGALAAQIRRAFEEVAVPDDLTAAITGAVARLGEEEAYAVRSSATAEDPPTASFAGQQDTFLNVLGPTPATGRTASTSWSAISR